MKFIITSLSIFSTWFTIIHFLFRRMQVDCNFFRGTPTNKVAFFIEVMAYYFLKGKLI